MAFYVLNVFILQLLFMKLGFYVCILWLFKFKVFY